MSLPVRPASETFMARESEVVDGVALILRLLNFEGISFLRRAH